MNDRAETRMIYSSATVCFLSRSPRSRHMLSHHRSLKRRKSTPCPEDIEMRERCGSARRSLRWAEGTTILYNNTRCVINDRYTVPRNVQPWRTPTLEQCFIIGWRAAHVPIERFDVAICPEDNKEFWDSPHLAKEWDVGVSRGVLSIGGCQWVCNAAETENLCKSHARCSAHITSLSLSFSPSSILFSAPLAPLLIDVEL